MRGQLVGRGAGGQERRHDRAGRRAGEPLEGVALPLELQHGADQAEPLDAAALEHEIRLRHGPTLSQIWHLPPDPA